jgi:hypothetical protein
MDAAWVPSFSVNAFEVPTHKQMGCDSCGKKQGTGLHAPASVLGFKEASSY